MSTPKQASLFLAALAVVCSSFSNTVMTTVPGGCFTVQIAGGTVAEPTTTRFAVPLVDSPQATGRATGAITALTATSLTIADGGWVEGALATTEFPYAIRIMTGAQAGLTTLVTANTVNTITAAGFDFSTLGVAVGDRIQIIPVHTLNTLFGSDTLKGATSAATADVVFLGTPSQVGYYHNTALGRWVRTTGPATDKGNVVILPEAMITVRRTAPLLSLFFVGRVPETPFVAAVGNSGNSYMHTGFPTDTTLGALSMQTILGGWVSHSNAAAADQLALPVNDGWLSYYHNGVQWVQTTGTATSRDNVVVPAGTGVLVTKKGFAPGVSLLRRQPPYTLN